MGIIGTAFRDIASLPGEIYHGLASLPQQLTHGFGPPAAQAPPPGTGPQPLAPAGPPVYPQRSHLGDVIDNLFFRGSFQRAAQDEYAGQYANYQHAHDQAQLEALAQQLPPEMRAAFRADPTGFLKNAEQNLAPQTASGGQTVMGPGLFGIGANRTAPLMSVQDGTPVTQTPDATTVTGPRLPGTVSATDGVILDNHGVLGNGGLMGTYSRPQAVPVGDGLHSVSPSVSLIPQRGQAPPPAQPTASDYLSGPQASLPSIDPQAAPVDGSPPPPAPPAGPDAAAAIRANPQAYFSRLLGPNVRINSGFRTPQKNASLPGASPTSEHLTNSAWDISVPGMSTTQVAQRLAASGLPFDQVIDEGNHTHIGFGPKNRGAVLQAQGGRYTPLASGPRIPQRGRPTAATAPMGGQGATIAGTDTVLSRGTRAPTPAPSGYAWSADGKALTPIPGGPADPGFGAPGGDSNLNGPTYLASLPQGDQNIVRAIAEGRMALPSSFALSKPYWQKIVQEVGQYDPTFDSANQHARVATRQRFTSGQQAQNITSYNTAIGHLERMNASIDHLGNSGLSWFNAPSQAFANATGDQHMQAAFNQFQTDRGAVASEMVRALRGSGGAEGDVHYWLDRLKQADSPASLKAVVSEAARLLRSRIEAMTDSYNSGMGTVDQTIPGLSPHAVDVLSRLDPQAGAADQNQPAAAPAASSGAGWRVVGVRP